MQPTLQALLGVVARSENPQSVVNTCLRRKLRSKSRLHEMCVVGTRVAMHPGFLCARHIAVADPKAVPERLTPA